MLHNKPPQKLGGLKQQRQLAYDPSGRQLGWAQPGGSVGRASAPRGPVVTHWSANWLRWLPADWLWAAVREVSGPWVSHRPLGSPACHRVAVAGLLREADRASPSAKYTSLPALCLFISPGPRLGWTWREGPAS